MLYGADGFAHDAARRAGRTGPHAPNEVPVNQSPLNAPRPRPRGNAPFTRIALLAVAAVAAPLFALGACGGGGAASKLATAHIPATVDYVGGIDVKGALESDMLKGLLNDQGMSVDMLTKALSDKGIKLSELNTLAFGAIKGDGGAPKDVLVIGSGSFDATALKSAIDGAKMAELAAAGDMPINFQQIEIVNPTTVVMGSGDLVKQSMGVGSGATKSVDTREELKDLRGAVDESATVWFTGPVPAGMDGMAGGLGMMGGSDLGKPTHFAFSADIGSNIKVRVAIRFASGDAGAVASQMDSALGLMSGMMSGPEADVLSSLDISGSGQILKASVSLSKDFLDKAAKGEGLGLPF